MMHNRLLLSGLAASTLAASASAATLSWTDTAFTDASQISTANNSVYALNFGNTADVTVNGVTFVASPDNALEGDTGVAGLVQWGQNDNQSGNSNGAYAGGPSINGLSDADATTLLDTFVFGDTRGSEFALQGLVIGETYTFQALVVDNRTGFGAPNRLLHFGTGGAGNFGDGTSGSVLSDYTSNDVNPDAGITENRARLIETTFVADSTTQVFATGIQNDGGIHFNAFQLRTTAVPEPSSLALLGLGGLFIARRRRG